MESIKYEWVIGAYTGAQAKHVKAQADAGIGYFFQREGGMGQNYTVYAAFRRPITGPRPEHLQLATPSQERILEKMRKERQGIHEYDTPAEPDTERLHTGIAQGKNEMLPVHDR